MFMGLDTNLHFLEQRTDISMTTQYHELWIFPCDILILLMVIWDPPFWLSSRIYSSIRPIIQFIKKKQRLRNYSTCIAQNVESLFGAPPWPQKDLSITQLDLLGSPRMQLQAGIVFNRTVRHLCTTRVEELSKNTGK